MLGANAQISTPIINIKVAMVYARRGPVCWSNLDVSAEPRIEATTYSVVLQA